MPIRRLHFILSLMLCGGAAIAQTATPGFYPNTNVVYSYVTGFCQGVCNDGTNTYFFDTANIQQRNTNYLYAGGLSVNKTMITNGLSGFNNLHLGDPDYFQGYLYAPMESGVAAPMGSVNIDVAVFLPSTLARYAAISISNYQSEASAICIDPNFSNSVALFVTSWASTSTNDGIYQYTLNNPTNLTFVRALPMSQNIHYIQGIICINGMLYVIADSGPYGAIYSVDPYTGRVTFLTMVTLPGNGEWEGLDYYQGYFIAAEAYTRTVNFYNFFNSNRRINGAVRDNYNNPITGVGVTASATINGTNLAVNAITDGAGNYSLSVPPGLWSVGVNCSYGANSLASYGNYLCPNTQTLGVTNGDMAAVFIVTNCTLVITAPAAFAPGEVGVTYSQALTANSCTPPFTWTIANGSLPAGLALSSNGTISGTPSASGTYNFTVQVTDGNNSVLNRNFSIGISNAVQVASTNLPDSSFCDIPLVARNGEPAYNWSLSPDSSKLPPGLTLSSNGILQGVPSASGTYYFSVRVTDSVGGVDNRSLAINLTQPFYSSYDGNHVLVTWPDWATNNVLQYSYDLASSNWITVTGAVPGTTITLTNFTSFPRQYFRLH